jgi:DNA-binding transcriptional MerR regulator
MPVTTERYRVDDLAERTETSIDTIRFYQKRGLLPPPTREGRIAWYDTAHLERIARIRELQEQGFPLALIERILTLDATDAPLAAAVLEAAAETPGPTTLTRTELAHAAHVPAAIVDAVVREGLLTPRTVNGAEAFSPADVDLLRNGITLLEAGIPMPGLLALAREHTAATRAIAEQAVALFDASVRQPLRNAPTTDDQKAAELVAAFRVLLPTVSDLVANHFRRTLLEIAQERLDLEPEALGDGTP